MSESVFRELARALGRLPNGFPQTELEIGLVHSVSNIQEGLWYVCNCCGCCCAVLRYINEQGIESSVAQAKLHRKPEEQIRHPPEDFSVWEQQRLQNRGLKEI